MSASYAITGPKVRAADANVDDVFDRLARVSFPGPAPNLAGKLGHAIEHGVDLGDHVLAVDDDGRALGRRRATCNTARSSVTLIFSPRNMASMRARRPDSSASCNEQTQCFVRHAVLGVIEKDARGLGRQPLAAPGIVGEQAAEMHVAHLGVVRFQGFPRGAITQSGCAHDEIPDSRYPDARTANARIPIEVDRSSQSVGDDLLGFGDDGVQVVLVAKALGIDLVDIFGARWPRGKPAALRRRP